MTFTEELSSWIFPNGVATDEVPEVGTKAPSTGKLSLPLKDEQPVVIAFMRHCGCPFAEKTFRTIRDLAVKNPSIHFIAVSHSNQASTDKWLEDLGGAGDVEVIVDDEKTTYAKWGLGTSSFLHLMSPWVFWNASVLGKRENINIRDTTSGTRWQRAGSFAVDREGTIRWAAPSDRADHIPNLQDGIDALRQ